MNSIVKNTQIEVKKYHLTYFLAALLLFIILTISYAQVDRTEKKLVNWVDENNVGALLLLKDIININSGTMNFEGVKGLLMHRLMKGIKLEKR